MNWELLHRVNALVIGVFIVTHVFAHAMGAVSPQMHAQMLDLFGRVYREPLLEVLLLFLLVMQTLSGLIEVRLGRVSAWRLVRNYSGLVLSVFLLLHVSWVLYTRHVEFIPTGFYWVAAGFAHAPLRPVLIGFYGLGMMAFFAHMIAVLKLSWTTLPAALMVALWMLSLMLTGLILAVFNGVFYPITVPGWLDGYYPAALDRLRDLWPV